MRPRWWRVAVLAMVSSLPGCDIDPLEGLLSDMDWSPSIEATPETCAAAPADGWSLVLGGDPLIEVGTSLNVRLFAPWLYDECVNLLTSLEWRTSVPSVVGIKPGDSVTQVILTGRAPGNTEIAAEFTLVGGHARTATLTEPVVVIPASSD